ncbi:MAG TPA: NAD(P)/FAD-dependent oxidoreductase [Vulgatibacter sp.]|nr:NAD(P)/FAD-dependent oxidoreductase [Vulgatibacter sp.]
MSHVVIVGGGFGGLAAARALKNADVDVTLVDRANYNLFQPLLYQVATSGLSTTEIATPIRAVVGDQKNTRVLLDEVRDIDLDKRLVYLRDERPLSYDFLVVAAGSRTNYFGNWEWARYGLPLKDLDDALELRRRVLLAFEAAEREPDEAVRRKLLSFVVIGGGPTGVELAGALAELSRYVLARDFRQAKPGEARVILIEALPRILPTFDEKLSAKAAEHLEKMGVRVLTGRKVTNIDDQGVHLGDELLTAGTVMWAAGVQARPLARRLGAELDRGGRVIVEQDCSVPGHPEVFVIGDMAHFRGEDGEPFPGLAPVAMQQGRYVADAIQRTVAGEERKPFRYRDKGVMATVGRSKAVMQKGRLKFDGVLAWLAWVVVHIWYLIGFRNRFAVLTDWAYSYLTYKRGARLITGRRLEAGRPSQVVQPSEIDLAARPQAERPEERPPMAPPPAEEQPPVQH